MSDEFRIGKISEGYLKGLEDSTDEMERIIELYSSDKESRIKKTFRYTREFVRELTGLGEDVLKFLDYIPAFIGYGGTINLAIQGEFEGAFVLGAATRTYLELKTNRRSTEKLKKIYDNEKVSNMLKYTSKPKIKRKILKACRNIRGITADEILDEALDKIGISRKTSAKTLLNYVNYKRDVRKKMKEIQNKYEDICFNVGDIEVCFRDSNKG